jgi:hypothetical protein
VLMRPVTQKFDAADNTKTVAASLRIMTPDMLVDDLAHVANFQKYDGRSRKWTVDGMLLEGLQMFSIDAQNPAAMVLKERGRYLSACLCIVRAYALAGMPDRLDPLASFENWSDLVRSALVWLGCEDPAASIEGAYAADETRQAVRRVVETWLGTIGEDRPLTVKEIFEKADVFDPRGVAFRSAINAAVKLKPGQEIDEQFGYWLRSMKGRTFEGVGVGQLRVQIGSAGLHTQERTTLWKLVTVKPRS